ncbi:MAG: O-antigen ligase family protein [Symploca sp. SIO3E6]|nr:O-antigen ligase family protein [Caldora sp. SIO3E6]
MAIASVLWYLRANHQSKQRWLSWGIAAISVILIPQTKSSGALFLFITLFALVVSTNFLKKLKFQYAVVGITSLLFITMLISILIVTNLEQILGATGKDLTLTGRTQIWADYWAAAQQRLWLGYAPYGFWQDWLGVNNPAEKWNTRWWMPPHTHNGFLDVTLDLGLIGLAILLLSFLVNLIQAIRYLFKGKGGESTIPLILLVYAFQVNLSETQFLRPYLLWFLYVLVTVKLSVTFVAESQIRKSSVVTKQI